MRVDFWELARNLKVIKTSKIIYLNIFLNPRIQKHLLTNQLKIPHLTLAIVLEQVKEFHLILQNHIQIKLTKAGHNIKIQIIRKSIVTKQVKNQMEKHQWLIQY